MRTEWINQFSSKQICMDCRRFGGEGFQSTWLPGIIFTKARASAMPDDECGLEGYGRAEYLARFLLFVFSPWTQRHWKKTCREGKATSCGKWRSIRVSEMCQTNTTCPQLWCISETLSHCSLLRWVRNLTNSTHGLATSKIFFSLFFFWWSALIGLLLVNCQEIRINSPDQL